MHIYLYLYMLIMPFARYLPLSLAWERQLGYCTPKTCTAPMCECFAVTTPTGSLLSHVLLSTTAIHQCSVALSIRAERFKCSPLSPTLLGELFVQKLQTRDSTYTVRTVTKCKRKSKHAAQWEEQSRDLRQILDALRLFHSQSCSLWFSDPAVIDSQGTLKID